MHFNTVNNNCFLGCISWLLMRDSLINDRTLPQIGKYRVVRPFPQTSSSENLLVVRNVQYASRQCMYSILVVLRFLVSNLSTYLLFFNSCLLFLKQPFADLTTRAKVFCHTRGKVVRLKRRLSGNLSGGLAKWKSIQFRANFFRLEIWSIFLPLMLHPLPWHCRWPSFSCWLG